MKKINIITAILSMVLLTGCKALYLSELSPVHEDCEQLLPALEPEFDRESLEYVYGTNRTIAHTRSKSRVSDFIGNKEVEGGKFNYVHYFQKSESHADKELFH